ncbi:RICIN domain-containing protein [Solwaraspora sp. WMMB335]|uniref:RICIN domain-containing protein n=1 Tax=Solwaraspora sp. WMMB335 TaxID=3404118 RepID=UPI003B94051F
MDAATARGFKVILAYWEDGAASGGRITNLAAWNTMWSAVTDTYGSNSSVYFEPMNEPHGYSSAEWRDIAADWLDYHYSAVPGRVLIGGTGYSQDLRDICNDSRFDSTLLSFHHYAFFYNAMTYDAFRSHIRARLGSCSSRTVATEFGAPMDNGLDYGDANSTDNFVRHIRAMAQVMRDNQMGGTYWPALGGKPTGSSGYDWYSPQAYRIRVGQYTHGGSAWQQWQFRDAGSGYWHIVSRHSGKCLDVVSASTADGVILKQYPCNGGTNQQWSRTAV